MKSAKVTAKPAAKPTAKAVATKPSATKPAKFVASLKTTALAKPLAIRKTPAPVTAKIAPKVATKTALKAVSLIVRDSFTMTAADQELLRNCKRNAIAAGRDSTKKSEIVRAALRHFAALSPSTQLMEINGLDAVKTGRPKKK